VFLVKELPPGEGGFHLDKNNQPYAKVIAAPNSDAWTIDVSHETNEMLVDPAGNRLQTSTSIEIKNGKIQDGNGEFGYLVEACDPCEADKFAYAIQGIALSDFITPHFYDPIVTDGTRYSFTGAIKAPRQVLPGGYISFVNQEANEVQQIQYVDPNKVPVLVNLGPATGLSLREWVDNSMRTSTGKATVRTAHGALNEELLKHCKAKRQRRVVARAAVLLLTICSFTGTKLLGRSPLQRSAASQTVGLWLLRSPLFRRFVPVQFAAAQQRPRSLPGSSAALLIARRENRIFRPAYIAALTFAGVLRALVDCYGNEL
jgi:hypothetical protein